MALTKSSKLMFIVVFLVAVFLLSSQLAFTAPYDFILNPMLGRKLLQDPLDPPTYGTPSGGSGGYSIPSGPGEVIHAVNLYP
ncbi:hypothetical protein SLEP1_g14629 [Rubroshorea leprosula]|uniref:Transmembrane protein n=1 Tax=Rubroshorea leprosula TaxID=152421 RepID=A0AAV5IJT9_9ROSI|nr:hypothetical protein SLEP1_g14629 [Rubroshorea leprosula]